MSNDGWEDITSSAAADDGWEDLDGWEDVAPKTSVREDLGIGFAGMKNTADRFISGLGMAGASALGQQDFGDKLYAGLQERVAGRMQEANPAGKEQGFGGKVLSALPQILTFPMSPADTGQAMIDSGETLGKAVSGAAVDTAGNMLGAAIPGAPFVGRVLSKLPAGLAGSQLVGRSAGAVSAGAVNAGQDYAVRSAISNIADQEATKKQFAPTLETTALGAVPGMVLGAAVRPVANPRTTSERVSNLRRIAEQETAARVQEARRAPIAEEAQMELPLANEIPARGGDQLGLFDEPTVRAEEAPAAKAEETIAIREQQADVDPAQRALFEPEQKSLDFAQQETLTQKPLDDNVNVPKQGEIDTKLGRVEIRETSTGFEAYKDGKRLGYLKDNLQRGQAKLIDEDANIDIVKVIDSAKKTGVGYGLYKAFFDKHEGRIAPSGKTTLEAWETWQRSFPEKVTKFVNQEAQRLKDGASRELVLGNITDSIVRNRVAVAAGEMAIPKGQRGGLNFQEIAEGFKILGNKLNLRPYTSTNRALPAQIQQATKIQADPVASSVVTKALEASPSKPNRYFAAGASLEALKTRSPVIDAVGTIVQNFGKRSEKWVREHIFPLERKLRQVGSQDLVELHSIMKEELTAGMKFTPDQLAQAGFTPKQVRAHQAMREVFDNVLRLQNEGRAAQGKEPITGLEGYHAARWDGDFGVELKNAKGEVVWKVRAGTRKGAMRQAKALMKEIPELTMGREFDRLNARGADTNNLQSAYSTMLDLLDETDPIVKQIKELVDAEAAGSGNAATANTQHFKTKTGMRGYVGDRPWVDSRKEAKEFFQQQIQYAKNASKWVEIQKAMPNLKEILSNSELVAKQPEQIKWAQEYVQNALGFGENKAIRALENEVGKATGVSPKAIADAIGGVKFVWITQKLMASVGYNAVNAIQLVNTTAWHGDLSAKGYSHNPIATNIMGLIGGMQLGTVHTADGVLGRSDSSKLAMLPQHLKAALEYAENNSVTNRSSYDETPVGQGNIATRGIGRTVSLVDTYTRGIAYMSFVQHLHDSGKFSPDNWGQMFKMAEDYTNASMADARNTEKAQIFSKAGVAGSAFNTLQTFNVNWFNQWSYFSRELARGNPRPFFYGLVTQGLVGGAMALPFVPDLDKAWEYLKTAEWFGKGKVMPTSMWSEVKDWSVRSSLMEIFGEEVAYGALSSMTDVAYSTRVSAPSLIEAPQIPGGMVLDLTNQLTSIAQAVAGFDDPVKWSQAALDVSPPGLKEFVAQTLIEEYTQSVRPDGTTIPFSRKDIMERGTGVGYARDARDQKLANYGLKSLSEVKQSDALYKEKVAVMEAKQRQEKLLDSIYSDIMNDRSTQDKEVLYQKIGGNLDSIGLQFTKRINEENQTAIEKLAADPKKTIRSMLMLKKLKGWEDERKAKRAATQR